MEKFRLKKWYVTATVVGSKYLGIVEAETENEAKEIAMELENYGNISLCNYCSDECEDGETTEVSVSLIED